MADIFMPVLDGIAAARRMQAEHRHIRVVVLTMDNDTNDVHRLIESDIAGFVMKDAPSSEVVRALDLAEKTVRNHLHNVFGKMAVAERTQTVILAMRCGRCTDQPAGIVARHGDNRFDPHR